VGFASCLTDCRRPGPSLYVAVCGRRDAITPRHVQKDPEAALTWDLKDEVINRGRIYYAKLTRGRAMFLAPRMVPYFHAIWGLRRFEEAKRLSRAARRILVVLRREWEMASSDLRDDAGVKDRATFNRALDELQAAMIVVPSAVYYQPKFTYIWTLGVGRFPDELRRRVSGDVALREIARCFLTGAGMTIPGELARVTGLSRREAGRGNRALVAEGFATMPAYGTYRLSNFGLQASPLDSARGGLSAVEGRTSNRTATQPSECVADPEVPPSPGLALAARERDAEVDAQDRER
jgi:hypothetical protein